MISTAAADVLHTKNSSHHTVLTASFLARDSIYAIAHYMLSPIRLSVTWEDQSKTDPPMHHHATFTTE